MGSDYRHRHTLMAPFFMHMLCDSSLTPRRASLATLRWETLQVPRACPHKLQLYGRALTSADGNRLIDSPFLPSYTEWGDTDGPSCPCTNGQGPTGNASSTGSPSALLTPPPNPSSLGLSQAQLCGKLRHDLRKQTLRKEFWSWIIHLEVPLRTSSLVMGGVV